MTKRILFSLLVMLSVTTLAYAKCNNEFKPYITYEGWRSLMQDRSQQLDIICLKDGRIFRGTLETRPDLQYSFGCIGFEPGEASVYAFNRGCVGEKVQVITHDGCNFVANPECQQIKFSVYKPYSKDPSDFDKFYQTGYQNNQCGAQQQNYCCDAYQDQATECYTQPYGEVAQSDYYNNYGYDNQSYQYYDQPQQNYYGYDNQGYDYYNQPQQYQCYDNPYDVCNPCETPYSTSCEKPRNYVPPEKETCQYQYDYTSGHYVQYQTPTKTTIQQAPYQECYGCDHSSLGHKRCGQNELCYAEPRDNRGQYHHNAESDEDSCDVYCQDCSIQTTPTQCERVRSEGQTETRIGVCTGQYERMCYEFTPEEVDYVIVHEGKRCSFSGNPHLFSVELTNGDQVPVEICGAIRVNNGFNEMCVNPKGTLEMRMAGGARNRYTYWDSLPRSFEQVVVQDAKLEVKVANDKRILTLPWRNILGIQSNGGSFSPFARGMLPCYPCCN